MIVYSEENGIEKRCVLFFSAKENESKRLRISIPEIIIIATGNANQTEDDLAKVCKWYIKEVKQK